MMITVASFSQQAQSEIGLTKKNGKYKIQYNGREYDANEHILTVKPKYYPWQTSKNKIKIIRENKLGFIDIEVPENTNIEDYIKELKETGLFETVEFNAHGEYNSFTPNDPSRSNQWHLSKINMPSAWDFAKGGSCITIGILDSGIDWEHEDIGIGSDSYQNIFLNPGEDVWSDVNDPTSGNGIDDDGNGLIDDWKGWNFENNSNDSRSNFYHGTFVSGIISAKTNNGTGIAGIAGGNNSSGVRLLSYCIGAAAPDASILDDAIISAVDNGVKVIQLSLGVTPSTAINSAIQYAIDNEVIVVCCSMNDSSSSVSYPASNSNVIAVGATATNDTRASFSNYGTELDIVAPGVDIYSTTLNDNYTVESGTSFAAPQVSAVAALLFSINSNLTIQQVRNVIESTAQKVGGYSYTTTSGHPNGTWNNQTGYGLLNAYAAVQAVRPYINGPIVVEDEATFNIANFPSGATVTWSASNSNLQLNSGQGTSAAEFESINYGSCIVYAAISIGCYSTTLQYNVTADFDLSDVYLEGPGFVCGPTATFILHNLPQPFTISWNGQSFLADSVYSVNTSYYSGNPGVAKVTVRANYKGKIIDMEHSFSFNYPGTYYVEDTVMYNNGFYYDSYRDVAGVSVSYLYPASGITYEWSCNNGWTLVSGGTDYAVFEGPPTQSNIDVKVCFNNPCGQRTCLIRELYMPQELLSLMISPNPATSETTVSIGTTSEQTSSFSASEEWSMEVYDTRQSLKTKVSRIKGNSAKLQTAGWMEGVYLVKAISKNRVLTGKLIVKR